MAGRPVRPRPLLMHLTTADISLELLIGPQLGAFAAAGYEVVGRVRARPVRRARSRRGGSSTCPRQRAPAR